MGFLKKKILWVIIADEMTHQAYHDEQTFAVFFPGIMDQ